jgi:HEAT repeat protein
MRFFLMFLIAAGAFAQTVAPSTEDRAWQTIEHALQDTNPVRRSDAVLAMAVVRPQPKAVDLVESALSDKDLGVRQSACTVLGGFKSKSSIPKLREALNDDAPEVVFAAAKALYDMGDPAGRQVLIAILNGDQSDTSGFVSSSVRDVKLKLHDPKALVLVGVNSTAGILIGPFAAGLPVAEDLLKDKQASGKTVAALLLATDTSPDSQTALKLALGDKNWTVRAAAARAIALRDMGTLYSDVTVLLDDKREEVQYSAAAALIRLKQPAPKKTRA